MRLGGETWGKTGGVGRGAMGEVGWVGEVWEGVGSGGVEWGGRVRYGQARFDGVWVELGGL